MLKKLLLALLLLALTAGGGVVYLTRQATDLPDWYRPETASEPGLPAAAALPPPLPARAVPPTGFEAPPGPDGRRELRLDERQLNELVRRSLDAELDGRRARQATKAIHADLDGDRLRIGAVTDLDRLLAAAGSEKERSVIRRLTRLAPWIRGRDFHLAVEGRPRAVAGELALDDLTVRIGQLSFEPEELLGALGLADEHRRAAVRRAAVRLPDMTLEAARVENEMLWLSLAAESR